MKLLNPEIRIETVNSCNSKCTICSRNQFTRKLMTMDNDHFFTLLVQGAEIGAETVSIFGFGEPLLDPDLATKVAAAKGLGLLPFITTNGSLLTIDKAKDLLGAGLDHVRFSVHGTFDNYEKVHRGLEFAITVRNIFNFIKIRDTIFDGKCKVGITAIPMHDEPISEIRAFWESKVDSLEIWRPHNWTKAKSFRKLKRGLKSCGRPFNGPVQINSDGSMMVCCFDYNGILTVGDTHKSSIEDILKGERFNDIRKKHEDGDLSGLICGACDQLNIEDESPLLYSSINKNINKTSSTKFQLDTKEF